MAALVETMFYTSNEQNGRFVPWHGLGTPVSEAPTSADALRIAGLDWNVIQKPISTDGKEIPNYVANIRDKDNTVLGVVSDRYKIVQNTDAFNFTDNLIGGDVRYETAGSLKNGKTIWLLAKMPEQKVLGDKIDPYICFTNSHDGTGAVRVCMTNIRVVCNNTLNIALSSAKRMWSTKHMGNIEAKLEEAKHTLEMANKYMDCFGKEAERLANITMKDEEIHAFLDELFPLDENASDRQKANVQKARDEVYVCYLAPDIAKFLNTKYGVLNAVSDWVGHATPTRTTPDYQSNNWGRIIVGHPVLDKAYELLTSKVSA